MAHMLPLLLLTMIKLPTNKILTDKKGAESVVTQLYWLGQLLLIVIVIFLPLFLYVSSVGSETSFMKNYVARDVALIVDAAKSIDGNLTLEYKTPKETKVFELLEDGVKVGTEKDSRPAFYFVLHSVLPNEKLSAYIRPSKVELKPGQILVIRKIGKEIFIEAK